MRRNLDFVDDGASWRVRRARELARQEREGQRAYLEERVGGGTLRWIGWALVPVILALAGFLAVVAAILVRTAGWLTGLWK